jgi:hypothetical protein
VGRGNAITASERDLEQYVRKGAGTRVGLAPFLSAFGLPSLRQVLVQSSSHPPNMMARMKGRVPGNLSYEALRLARSRSPFSRRGAFQDHEGRDVAVANGRRGASDRDWYSVPRTVAFPMASWM